MSQFTQRTAQHELIAFATNLKICGRYSADAVARYAEDLARAVDRKI